MTLLVGSIFHMTRKIVSEMTYNVSMGTLNPTIPYHTETYRDKQTHRHTDIASVMYKIERENFFVKKDSNDRLPEGVLR